MFLDLTDFKTQLPSMKDSAFVAGRSTEVGDVDHIWDIRESNRAASTCAVSTAKRGKRHFGDHGHCGQPTFGTEPPFGADGLEHRPRPRGLRHVAPPPPPRECQRRKGRGIRHIGATTFHLSSERPQRRHLVSGRSERTDGQQPLGVSGNSPWTYSTARPNPITGTTYNTPVKSRGRREFPQHWTHQTLLGPEGYGSNVAASTTRVSSHNSVVVRKGGKRIRYRRPVDSVWSAFGRDGDALHPVQNHPTTGNPKNRTTMNTPAQPRTPPLVPHPKRNVSQIRGW
jgi:hypothetical protein